ncbi:bacterial proteasome activator family protein [Gordonia aurantiaca]|uniref:bacterial proteasome activator family protein n=1 Tax=Gordonia sp. B21 TaxID=3151852 RepID=UPI003262EE7C
MAIDGTPGHGPNPGVMRPGDNVIIVGSHGEQQGKSDEEKASDESTSVADMVEQPAKVMRIGTMIKQLLEEVRAAPLDEASRNRLREIHQSSIRELEDGLAPELREELERLALPFTDEETPSDAELRIAQAQLVGWLEGLFHGIQTALFAQQMAARAQLEQMRQGALPAGMQAAQHNPGHSTGQYL